MTERVMVLFISLILLASAARPALPEGDRIRIAEASRLADALGNRLWPGWDKAPFAVLLVTPEHEFLIRHPKPSDDFTFVSEDALLKSTVWFRKRQYNADLSATFPVGGVPTIVIGQAENTSARTSTRWVVTLLHEHFHQLQYSQPRYYAEVEGLGLAQGDRTGMWMLNYPFPYTKAEVKEAFSEMCRRLAEALRSVRAANFAKKLKAYLEAKEVFRSLLAPDDYKYFSFQLWQEGIARYTEYRLAELAAARYEPSREFRNLADYTSFKQEAGAILKRIEDELISVRLDEAKRTAFYAVGAAEGLVLDRANPGWRKRYFEEKFSLDEHFRVKKVSN
jgi:hypothetical protein